MHHNKNVWEEPIEFGNHKGSIKNTYPLEIKLKTEAEHALSLPIPLENLISVIVTVIAAMKFLEQSTIDEYVG